MREVILNLNKKIVDLTSFHCSKMLSPTTIRSQALPYRPSPIDKWKVTLNLHEIRDNHLSLELSHCPNNIQTTILGQCSRNCFKCQSSSFIGPLIETNKNKKIRYSSLVGRKKRFPCAVTHPEIYVKYTLWY